MWCKSNYFDASEICINPKIKEANECRRCFCKTCVFFVDLPSAATVTIECRRCFCNSSRHCFYVFNLINSDVHYGFFNALFSSARSMISGINRLLFLFRKSRFLHLSSLAQLIQPFSLCEESLLFTHRFIN